MGCASVGPRALFKFCLDCLGGCAYLRTLRCRGWRFHEGRRFFALVVLTGGGFRRFVSVLAASRHESRGEWRQKLVM